MIIEPLNDTGCLQLLHQEARRRAELAPYVEFAQAFQSTDEIAAFIRTRPQKLDLGNSGDGPRIACIPTQRLRHLPTSTNCFEATCTYLTLADVIDPSTPRTSCTIRVGAGYHTFPVERGRAVILDPETPPRNALNAGIYACERRNGSRPSLTGSGDAPAWLIAVAANAAQTPGERRAVRNAAQSINRAVYRGEPLEDLAAVAEVIALAESQAELWGEEGIEAVRNGAGALRNLQIGLDAGRYKGLAKRLGKRALQAYVLSQAGPLGVALLRELDSRPKPRKPVSKRPEKKRPQSERDPLSALSL